MLIKFNLPLKLNISFIILNKKQILIANYQKDHNSVFYYIIIPKTFKIKKLDKSFLSFSNSTLNNYYKSFPLYFSYWLKSIEKPIIKKLILKGLGLKSFLSLDLSTLELKVGLSHSIFIPIPVNKIKVKIIKNTIIIEGSNFLTVTTFVDKIKKYKLPNIYKGKGIWHKNEVIKLKIIKKT
jgi:large subunit ribosomal protein L6